MAQTNRPDLTAEDIEAGAYFPEAQDWLEIGRRRIRHRLGRIERRLVDEFGKRVVYPVETEDCFYLMESLGYRAERKSFDYCIRHGHMDSPAKEGRRLLWDREDVVAYAMQLERMRYWLPGRYEEKKTVWELHDESQQRAPAYDAELQARIDALDADGLLDLMVEGDGPNAHNVRAHIAGYFAIRMWERDQQLDAVGEELLRQVAEEDDSDARKAAAVTLRRRLAREDA